MTESTESGGLVKYGVHSQWAGWFGGFGHEPTLEHELNQWSAGGWRLVSVQHIWAMWYWIVPRPRLLYIFEVEGDPDEVLDAIESADEFEEWQEESEVIESTGAPGAGAAARQYRRQRGNRLA